MATSDSNSSNTGSAIWRFFRNPEYERIVAALDAAEIEVMRRAANQDKDKPAGSWLGAAKEGIARARARFEQDRNCLLYTSPSPRDGLLSRMPSSA